MSVSWILAVARLATLAAQAGLVLATYDDLSSFSQITIPPTSFDSQADFYKYWKYNYPWGDAHNGAARMDPSQIVLAGNRTLMITARRVNGVGSVQFAGREIEVHYISGTFHARELVNVSVGGGYDFEGEFLAMTDRGVWPAFWLTAAKGWPPELDLLELKGSGKISFNTFNTSTEVEAVDVPYPDPHRFHALKCELRDVNGRDLMTNFYLDGQLVTTQYARDFVGKPMYLIIDLQMEGSSGSPGPDYATPMGIRNLSVTRYTPLVIGY